MLTESGPLSEAQARQMNPVVLAFVGDAVYTLLVRERLAVSSGEKAGRLNKRASELVSAHGQSGALERILPLLTEEELAVFKRGRNAHVHTIPPSASRVDYLRATALECLLGYLYLSGRRERVNALFAAMMEEERDAT